MENTPMVVQQFQMVVGSKTLKSKVENNKLLISWQQIQETSSAFAQFSVDTINQISAGLIENPEELHKLIQSCNKSDLLSITQQGNVLIKFKYDIGGKIKTKDINLILRQNQFGEVQTIKIQNEKLKIKITKLEKEVADLKGSYQNLQGQISWLTNSLAPIQNKWHLVDKFFINEKFYQLNEHWQLQTYTNVVEFVRNNKGQSVRVSGITVHQNQSKDKRFLLQ